MNATHHTWQLRSITQIGPNEFKAFIRGPKNRPYLVGTFSTESEAFAAILDAMTARWMG